MQNPIRYVDPDGRSPIDWRDKNGNLIYDVNKGQYTKYATAEHKRLDAALMKTSAALEWT